VTLFIDFFSKSCAFHNHNPPWALDAQLGRRLSGGLSAFRPSGESMVSAGPGESE